MKCDVVTLDNKKAGSIDLDESVFGVSIRADILARMVNYQLAKRRAGTHKTKTIGEIRGSTAKPWAQKGSGRARAGSRRSTQWRGGQTVFGPVVRSHAFSLNKKVRRLALKTALSSKIADGKLIVLSDKGELVIAPAVPTGFKPTGRVKAVDGKCWTVPVLSHGKIYCRTAAGELAAVDVSKKD